MLFNSAVFVIFFALVFVIYWRVLGNKLRQQNLFLLCASMLFYGWWDWRFLFLILFTIATSYTTAILAERSHARLWTTLNVVVNVAILFVFKYFNFFRENALAVLNSLGFYPDWFTIDVLLPVGISFYTFQAIGYSIDVYRGDIRAEHNIVSFALFVSFFPQLVAGPIESARSLLPQINNKRRLDQSEVVLGMRQALRGLIKKILVADACAFRVDEVFSDPQAIMSQSSLRLAYIVILFSVQIYCDFSGYCDIARGSARCLGIRLMHNFNNPYFSRNVQEFWRRWNISLMKWFTNYIYIPLGGSRRGNIRTYANLMIVFALSGLWHGASWNFVIWGLYWGIIMVCFRLWRNISGTSKVKVSAVLPGYYTPMMTLTLFFALIGWAIFRCSGVDQVIYVVRSITMPLAAATIALIFATWLIQFLYNHGYRWIVRMVSSLILISILVLFFINPVESLYNIFRIYAVAVFAIEWYYRNDEFTLQRMPSNKWLRYSLYWFAIFMILTNGYDDVQFIYFQF